MFEEHQLKHIYYNGRAVSFENVMYRCIYERRIPEVAEAFAITLYSLNFLINIFGTDDVFHVIYVTIWRTFKASLLKPCFVCLSGADLTD